MTNKERDLLIILGIDPKIEANRRADLLKISEGVFGTDVAQYGIRIKRPNDSHWWDIFSSLMQANHETSINSLNDDNRNDEKEIELLEEARSIVDNKELDNLQNLVDFYTTSRNNALLAGDRQMAAHYEKLAEIARGEYNNKFITVSKADNIVAQDKSLISSHNPLIEAFGEIVDYAATGAGIGAVGASFTGVGSVPAGILGSVVGTAFGLYDVLTNGTTSIDRSAYTEPESPNKSENYLNSISTRQSYKDLRSKAIESEQSDLLYWQTLYPVSDYYRYIESTGKGNYLYYNLPGIIGSSFSDTKDAGQQLVGTYGLSKLASKTPGYAKYGLRASAFAVALMNGWQQSLNENHAEVSEVSTKKAIDLIKNNKPLKDEMLSGARKVASELYGLSNKAAEELIDENTALMMYLGGVGGLNPRQLNNNYDYYKMARQAGDVGADSQFERDMMATAGTDVLEAALMATPYGALAKKSKMFGRAIAGAGIGAATGQFLGFGVGGSVIGGVVGGVAAQNRLARKIWNTQMRKVLAIEDKVLPQLERQIMFDKGVHAVSAFGVTSLAEAAEEGVQYLNSLDAAKILDQALDDIDLGSIANLFVNDLKKRGEVFNAVLSQIGLTDSPYQNDLEFWANWKGGLFLGGLMTGATVSLQESIGAKKAYQTAQFVLNEVLSSVVANRTAAQDAILKGAAFAKYGANNDASVVLDIIDRAKTKNKYRENTVYSDEDFDSLSEQANRIISQVNHKVVKNRLKQLGYELGSDEANYAISVRDYYLLKTKDVDEENNKDLAEKIQLLNDPAVLEHLNVLAGEEKLQAEDYDSATNTFTFKERQADGSIIDRTLTNRERLLKLHQNAAEFIAVSQLLSDLNDTEKLIDYAKSKGIAFDKSQIERSISILKDKHDLLKNDIELYSNERFDSTTTTYNQQIQHVLGYLLDATAGMKLADIYRNSALRMLNQNIYTNIIKSLAIDSNVDATNEDVRRLSMNMSKQFIDNVTKNKKLQEIIDYNIETEFKDSIQEEDNQLEELAASEPEEQKVVEDQQKESLWSRFKNKFKKIKLNTKEFVEDAASALESDSEDEIVQNNEEVSSDEIYEILDPEEIPEIKEPVVTNSEGELESGTIDNTPIEDQTLEQAVIIDLQQQQNAIIDLLQTQQVDNTAVEVLPAGQEVSVEEQESAVIIEDLQEGDNIQEDDLENEEEVVDQIPLQTREDTINRLRHSDKKTPRKLLDGWYITEDGKILPSDKMYMANPTETPEKMGLDVATKYKLVAAQIRFNIHRFLKDSSANKGLNIRKYVAKILKTDNISVIEPVVNALLNNDQNAIKLLIMHANPRLWESYYVNEFFRDAAKKILTGNPIVRPDYIDKEKFKEFCRQVLLYKHNMESKYGFLFVVDSAPAVTIINGQEVVADPDFVAVDDAGNAHIVNVYTITNTSYRKQQNAAEQYIMQLGNTKSKFSQHQERSAYASIQTRAFLDTQGVQISSTSLLPVVVDGYTAVHRLYLGKLIPIIPNEDNITKYANLENQLEQLNLLLELANEKAKKIIQDVNNVIDNIRNYRNSSRRSGARLRKRLEFNVEQKPQSIAEAYAQLDRALNEIQAAQSYYSKYLEKEVSEMEKFQKEEAKNERKLEISKLIERINNMPDETQDAGIVIDIVDGDNIINNKDIITKGVFKALLEYTGEGIPYVKRTVEYEGKVYNIKIHKNPLRKYGKKNGGIFEQNTNPDFTKKMRAITDFLVENPDVILSFDVQRSFITYEERASVDKPVMLNSKDSIITATDINNLGVLQDDGKIVDVGFFDEKTGVIQSGQLGFGAILGSAPDGTWYQNQLFIVIKQKHLEDQKHPDRRIAIPLIKSKFNKNLSQFIATCYKTIALANHSAESDLQQKSLVANQMLHLFIGKRMTYKKGQDLYPNVVYINGDSVILNGLEFFLLDDKYFGDFVKELQKCEIMPNWNTLNVKFKNLAKSTMSHLYEHFSESDEDLHIQIDGIDSGLVITKEQFENDTLCQWLVRNDFFATKWFVKQQLLFSMHNMKLGNKLELEVKEDLKETTVEVQNQPQQPSPEQPIEMSEEEFEKLGLEEVGEDDEEDDSYEYASPIIYPNKKLSSIRKIKSAEQAIKLISKRYPKLAKLMKIAASRIGMPQIHVLVSDKFGDVGIINGVERTKQGRVILNEDKSWSITLYADVKDPIKTLAHELVHVFTLGAIKDNKNFVKSAKIFYDYLKDILSPEEKTLYGFRNFKEFIAEFFTNSELQDLLKLKSPAPENIVELSEKYRDKTQKHKNAFQSVLSFISRIWQKYILRKDASVYSQIYDTVADVFYDFSSTTITEENEEYLAVNHATGQKVTLNNFKSRAQLKAAVDGIMTAWIKHENITELGKNIDKLNFTTSAIEARLERDTEFAQWFQRTFTYHDSPMIKELTGMRRVTDESLKSESNPEGFVIYEKKVKLQITVKKKDGTTVTKTVRMPKSFVKLHLNHWDLITPFIDEFMSDMRIETRKRVNMRNEDQEMSDREDGRNIMGELLTESYEISPFDKASREVKWMFSTVPYGEVVVNENQLLEFRETTDHNEFGFNTFMPYDLVYGKVLYYMAGCTTTDQVLLKFRSLAETGPDKAMFLYLYNKLSTMLANRWKAAHEPGNKSNPIKNEDGKFFDANVDSTIIKVIRALRQQLNNFIWTTVENKTDKDGNTSKHLSIRTTLYQKGAIMSVRNWRDQLTTGVSGILRYNSETQSYEFKGAKKQNVFLEIYRDLFGGSGSFVDAYNKSKKLNPEDVLINWRYLGEKDVPFSQITADDVETYLHNALLECGIDVRPEVLQQWLNDIISDNPTITNHMDALYALLSDQNSKFRPSAFFERLANINLSSVSVDERLTDEVIDNAFNSGFVKQLANIQNEYDLKTQGLMTVAAHNNQYYIVSESNFVNDTAQILNDHDDNDAYIQMLKEDSFASGSVIVEALSKGEDIHLEVGTFVGMKTKNIGDQGRDYFEIEQNEDFISKLELLHEGYMISPTTSDKKTYHTMRGIPLVGIRLGVRSNSDCYYADRKSGKINIIDLSIIDRFILYFKSERDAVEKAIKAYEDKFYERYPGKKIENYSDGNGMKFSSFCCLPLANGEKMYLNNSGNPRDNLSNADRCFFNLTKYEQRKIMQEILMQRTQEDINKAVESGLIKLNLNGNYENIGLDGDTIQEMAQNIMNQVFGSNSKMKDYVDQETNEKHAGPRKEFAISFAIREYITDCSIKHLMSMLEYQRLFSGSKSFYKWKSKGKHVTDISVDYTKRRGGDISTGGVNISDIPPFEGMEELGSYRCIELKDEYAESKTLSKDLLISQFETSELVSIATSILSGTDASPMNVMSSTFQGNVLQKKLYDLRNQDGINAAAEAVIYTKYYNEYVRVHKNDKNFSEKTAESYAKDILQAFKLKAKSDAIVYFKDQKGRDQINVADGATYITDRMCEKLLREEGKFDDDMKYAFEVLRGEHGAEVLSELGRDLYKSILDVIIGTQKYTATGFRKSDDGQGGTLMTPYYNKTALFPIFEQIAYGKIGRILDAMRRNNVDMVMMTSAVKTGSLGSIKAEDFIGDSTYEDHVYILEIRYLRKQLNTDPSEKEESNFGTQTIKIALSNLRMDDDYTDPLSGKSIKGKELYSNIMKCYNILADIGFEKVMRRFAKRDSSGNTIYTNSVVANYNTVDISSIPEIDEAALSKFLREELMSRDANDNMFDAIAYDSERDSLAAPLSAISLSGWIDSILSSYIGKTIVDTNSPGTPYIQRSIFYMEGDGFKTLNDGEDLRLVNDDGSMDAIISVDFFKDIVPNYENKTFEEVRQWLIDHKLIGRDAKTYTISYRIPTQAQSSINALKFVDIIPIVRDTIILPTEFTRLTGSDFDIDKLYLSRLFINPDSIENEDQMFTFFDSNESADVILENLRKGFTNKLFLQYLTLLMDKNSASVKWRSIDSDTELWHEVYEDLYPEESKPLESMQLDTIAYQVEQKNNFVVGKIGIGPYALNNNNHIYTMLYNISLNAGYLTNLGEDGVDMSTLYRDRDIYGKSIMSWLSGGINVHVDIAKDPFVTKMNINKYTYNMSVFLLRAGFGRNALWFLNQPVIKELAKRQNAISGEYLKKSNKNVFDAQKEVFEQYKKELAEQIPAEVLNSKISEGISEEALDIIRSVIGHDLTVGDILLNLKDIKTKITFASNVDEENRNRISERISGLYIEMFETPYMNDMVQKDKNKSMIYREAKNGNSSSNLPSTPGKLDSSILRYMSVLIFNKLNESVAKTTSDIVRFTKIDTKKYGSTIASQLDFIQQYDHFIDKVSYGNVIFGDYLELFGTINTFGRDVVGFNTCINLQKVDDYVSNALPGISINERDDITEAGYIRYNRGQFTSFIDNKTRKVVNTLTTILKKDSLEATYGFRYIWQKVKFDFGRQSLTEDMQSKLRSTILGAFKNMWLIDKMKSLGIDPISLFKDQNNSYSLAHELYRIKTLTIRHKEDYINRNGEQKTRTRITSVAKLFKDNAILNMLHDGHSEDIYKQTELLVDILDFIKIHIPYTDDTKKANVYINAWRELYNNDLTKDFAVKLMFYSLLTSNDQGGNNLFKYVPYEMLEEYGLFDFERDMISTMNDLNILFAGNNEESEEFLNGIFGSIIDRVETILCEDFDFCPPVHIEAKKEVQDRLTGRTSYIMDPQYTGFASVFGNSVTKNGQTTKSDRIPYVFIPAKVNSYGNVSKSKTIVDSYGRILDRKYIRVYNPVSNYENQQKYFIYKKIGEVFVNQRLILPIYQLVDNSMYTLGEYKIYNYENELKISSTKILKTIEEYIYSSPYSMQELNDHISKAVDKISKENIARAASESSANFRSATQPLEDVDQYMAKMHAQMTHEYRVFRIKNNILPEYEDSKYLDTYMNRNNNGKQLMRQDLSFVLSDPMFTKEEKDLAVDMLDNIYQLQEKLEQAKANKKSPTDREPKRQQENNNDPQRFNDAQLDLQIINSSKTILSNEELAIWNKAGVGDMPRILVASERTDPAFHVKQILDILDGKESVLEWSVVDGKRAVVGNVSGKDFAGLYLITKHDGLPMQKLLETKIPKLIHFSITGLGGTEYEPGVMKPDDLLDRIAEYIKMGLDPNTVTIRIDPIVPGVTTPGMIRNIIKRSSEMGIKRIRFSIMDAYPNTVASMSKLGYDFERNYGTNPKTGKPNFTAKREIIDKIVDTMVMLKNEYNVTLGTCAEGLIREGVSKEGCLSVESVNRMLGTSIEDKGTANNDQRVLCSCYGGKIDALKYNATCASHCIYCYAKHENDKALEYYNEDGTLKDNVYTRVNSEDVGTNKSTEVRTVNGTVVENSEWITADGLYLPLDMAEFKVVHAGGINMSFEFTGRQNLDGEWIFINMGGMEAYENLTGYRNLRLYDPDGTDVTDLYRVSARTESVKNVENVQKKVSVSTTTYTSESVKNPRTAVVFTENMQAEYARRKNTPSSSTLKVNVTEGTTGTNQAVVRMSDDTTYNPNAFGLIVKKYQQDNHGRWFYDDKGNFLDTDADFTMFKEANEAMFDRLSSFDGDTIVFPASAAMGKAALPKRFAEWLAQKLYERYGLFTVVKPNPKYTGKFGVYIYENTGTINVSSYDENTKSLSNFAEHPFETELAKGTPKMKFNSVELAFQSSKAYFAWSHGDINDKLFWDFINYIKSHEGSDVKKAGGKIPMSLNTISEWNRVLPDVKVEGLKEVKVSDQTLYMMMLHSFQQNETSMLELLRTGNSEFTHNYKNGEPIEPKNPKRFGALLSKVRSKLRDEQLAKEQCK